MAEQAVPTQAPQAQASEPSVGTAPVAPASTSAPSAPTEDYKSKWESAQEDLRAWSAVRDLARTNPELREHLEATYRGQKWQPKQQEAPKLPEQPKTPELPKDVMDKLAKVDQLEQMQNQINEQRAFEQEDRKVSKEIQEANERWPILKDPKVAATLSERFNNRVLDVARSMKQQNPMATDRELIDSARVQVTNQPYRSLVYDLMEKEIMDYVAQATLKGANRMQGMDRRGDRVVAQPAGQSPNDDAQFEAEMKAASSGRNVDHTKRAQAILNRGVTPRDMGWPD